MTTWASCRVRPCQLSVRYRIAVSGGTASHGPAGVQVVVVTPEQTPCVFYVPLEPRPVSAANPPPSRHAVQVWSAMNSGENNEKWIRISSATLSWNPDQIPDACVFVSLQEASTWPCPTWFCFASRGARAASDRRGAAADSASRATRECGAVQLARWAS